MKLKPVTKSRLSEAAIAQIKDLISSNKLAPESKLPSERELVHQLRISRTSVREALRMLEIMGLVEVKPGKGAYVKEVAGDLFLPLPRFVSLHKETLQNHFEARLVLEPAAAAFAARRGTRADTQRLKACLGEFQSRLEDQDLVGMIRADIQFHRLIAAATGNKTIKLLMDTITKYLFDGWKATLRIEGRPQKTIQEHSRILEAILVRDEGRAKRAMRNHLMNAVRNLKGEGLG
jgi:GntR family transcriptional repressor for pyruvate dehydrogenase complex